MTIHFSMTNIVKSTASITKTILFDLKSLQIDSLCPWTGDEYQKRSSLNTPFSIEDQRVIRLHPRNRTSTYKLHQYSKRHVGNPRLEKKTVYLMKEKKAFGIVMLMYRYCSTRRVRRENSQANNVNNVRDERTIRQSRNRPIFEQDLSKIPFGDRYVTVLEDRIEEIFDDDRIIDFMSNPHKIDALRQPESMNPYFPSLPPLISGTGCFVFFIEENKQSETKLKFADGLGDWRGNELQHPVSQSGKKIMIDYEEGFRSMFKKYSLRNARIDRLKKYIFYLTREGKFWKNIMIVYHYEHPGEIPEPVSEEMKKALLSGRVLVHNLSPQNMDHHYQQCLANR
uniref:NOT2_3_5 domain-containing protein n=2 Tax=Caenorhabditis tropicalis TaxID=1561998 RepID=A0A1I7UQI7_9PELO